jgi:segregation and condensation protein A
MTAMYEIKTEKFNGPLDLLLQLIDEDKLGITEVSLSQVTDQYLARLEKMTERDPEELADFLVVAARLLLLKSRALLPEIEEEEPDDLAGQLKLYKEFVEAAQKIKALISEGRFTFSRDRLPIKTKPEFSPPPALKLVEMKNAFLAVLRRLDPLIKLPKLMIEKAISLQQKILEIHNLLKQEKYFSFGKLVEGAKSKTEIIVNFLALLELLKQQKLRVKQGNVFREIVVERI